MSSNGASVGALSSTFPGILDTRSRLSVRDEIEIFRLLGVESKLNRGPKIGEVPPISNDLRYP